MTLPSGFQVHNKPDQIGLTGMVLGGYRVWLVDMSRSLLLKQRAFVF